MVTGSDTTGGDAQRSRRLPTMRDIADHVGVSRQLVSLVLRESPGPSADSRARILAAANELGYRPNASARLLRQRRTHLLGVMFDLRNPFEVRFVERLVARAATEGFSVVLGAHTPDRTTDIVVSELIAQRVEALVAFNPDPGSPSLHDALDRLPVVWLGEKAPTLRVDNVRVDESTGLHLAVGHLVGLGHRKIAYLGGQGGLVGRDRAAAYLGAMVDAGLTDDAEVIECDFTEEGGAAAARAIVVRESRPTAVISCGDVNAAGVLAVFARSGIRVPEDISVIGFDDSYVASLSYHQLTSVRQDVDATVQATMSTVLERLSDTPGAPGEVLTPTTLMTRASTGPRTTSSVTRPRPVGPV